MAERTLAENAAQAISDFKAIKNAMNTSGEADVFFNIPDGTPTSEYAKTITAAIPAYGEFKYQYGEAMGYERGLGNGKQAQREEFWNNFWSSFKHPTTSEYVLYGAFAGGGWNADTFYPIYPYEQIVSAQRIHNMMYCFNRNAALDSPLIDLTEFCQHVDFSQCIETYCAFRDARACNITVDFSNVKDMQSCFDCGNGGKLENITLKVSEKCTNFGSTFHYCSSLSKLTFTEDSVIAANINLSYSSSLTHDSLMSIINALKDFSGTTTTKILSLHAYAKARLTDAEIAIATQKGWTVA